MHPVYSSRVSNTSQGVWDWCFNWSRVSNKSWVPNISRVSNISWTSKSLLLCR